MAEYPRTPKHPIIDPPLAAELEGYKGRWVAVDQGRVVSAGDSATEVLARALEHSVTDPLIFRVPEHPGRLNFF